ncbi:D-glycero-beta-D-manno-heptose-7-phosphate kinase [Candidatus Woesearchaeota archaeon]|nr:D-glycero-beta-D-manno-heptose-7-phosphate kinase [Candidatus Woesearchaeota archaeon]
MKNNLIKIMSKFKEKKILVIGDVILDKYVFGDVSRVSPEAPIPLVDVSWENFVPGGAANAANNLASLGAQAYIIGVIGEDQNAVILLNKLNSRGIKTDFIVKDKNRRTILKERIVARSQQLLRVDYDTKDIINENIEKSSIISIKKIISEVDSVIVSDYAKGFITKNIMEEIIKLCRKNNKNLIIDPRPDNQLLYQGATLITPNYDEASKMAEVFGKEEDNLNLVGNKLRKKLNSDILITRGSRGMTLFSKEIKHFTTKAKEVYDVSGAGDTVVATLTLALSAGATMEEAIMLANYAAGNVVGKFGTATTTVIEIEKSIKNDGEI